MLKGVFFEHPNDHRSADRVGQNPHIVEALEQVPVEGFRVEESGAYDLQPSLSGGLSIIKVKPIFLRAIQHNIPALLQRLSCDYSPNLERESLCRHQHTIA